MKANSEKTKQSKKATRRVLAGVLCGASVLSLVLSLVMPPISQAIANDAQTVSTEETVMGGGSSSESTDVDNTNNGDTENQNSDDAKGGETDPTNGVEQNQAEDQPEGELQVEDGSSSNDDAVMAAAEGGQTKTAANEITSANDLVSKLEAVEKNGIASFDLTTDVECGSTIQLDESGSNITLNLNGHKIKYTNQSQSLFNITGGATLTIKDLINDSDPEKASEKKDNGQLLDDQGQDLRRANYGKEAELVYDADGIPSGLTYYVTESSPSEIDTTKTTETLFGYSVDIKGAIVACGGNENLELININGGHFSLENGVITQGKDCHVRNLVYAANNSTVNMNGGYVCGGYCPDHAAGAGISVENSTLSISDGVIAGNRAPSGGGVYANRSAVTVAGGVISGNSTLNNIKGYGGGIMAENGGSVTVSGGYITNNRYANFCYKDGDGCHGGGGLAAIKGAHVTIFGGQITGNYSEEAGGGVYVTNIFQQDSRAWLDIKGGNIASNVSYRSEGAGIRVGQRVDAMINGPKDSNGTKKSTVYITNNHCMSRFDWGGGGIFVQGDSKNADNAGRLFVYNSYISSNTAGGYGGGVAVCPSGKTLVTNTEGTAIFGNSSAGNENPGKDHPNPAYKQEGNSGNDKAPHLSAGNDSKDQDKAAYLKDVFRDNGHADFFLAAHDHNTPIAVVTGEMLGGGDARYSGSIELEKAINIPANGAVGVKNSIGLTSGVMSGVMAKDEAAINARNQAQNEATTFITGNYSWDHGGGIMSNGDLYLGQPADTYVYPSLKLKATKELTGRNLKAGEFTFTVYRKDSDAAKAPSWDDNDNFSTGDCEPVKSVPNSADGNIAFDLSEKLSKQLSDQFKTSGTGETTDYDITYYMVENAGDKLGVKYDHAVYEIKVKVKCTPTELMSVPIQGKPNETKKLMVYNFTIDRVDVTKIPGGSADSPYTAPVNPDADGYYSIANSDGSKTFTNTYTPYTSSGSWTPQVTKEVDGGEMKKFKFELANDENFTNPETVTVDPSKAATDENGNKTVPVKFATKNYELKDLENGSKTFTYYVREKKESSTYPHYKFDQSVYRFKVVATDNTKGGIDCAVTYKKGTVGSDGNWTADASAAEEPFTDDSTPTFTNTYSTSLPLSGMSGVTLTYLAGAAVLCAAAAWMHIRRKANAKGGKRRE